MTGIRSRKAVIGFALVAALLCLPLYAIKVWHKTDYTDFQVYYLAAKRASLGQWSQIYNLRDGASPFRYAPPWLPFFRPFAALSLPVAQLSWYFLQVLWFALGFFCLKQALKLTRRGRTEGGFITAVAFLFILRFCLDCFTIGQVSSLLFFGYCAGLWAWMARRPGATGAALLLPASFKIGPGFLYSLFAASPKPRERVQAIGVPLLLCAAGTLFLRFWCGSWDRMTLLWRGWAEIVADDSVYYDASHYGSQSIKSALLRAVKSGWVSASHAHVLYVAVVVLGCLAILGFWLARRPKNPLGRGALFALGVFPYLWFMPETFKYSLTTLALPVTLLLAQKRKPLVSWLALGFGAATLSLAGLDIVGSRIFFALQYASVPLMATLLLGLATLKLALDESRPAWRPFVSERGLGPWPVFPSSKPTLEATLLIPLPMQSFSTLHASWLRKFVEAMHAHFSARPESFEILLVPFGNRADRSHPAWEEAGKLVKRLSGIQLLEAAWPPERGAALRDGFLASRGRAILSASAEQPCEPDFYARAQLLLRSGEAEVVRANRRLAESRFRTPVRYLSIVYSRHRLGLLFNRLVRALLPVGTTDTHSGSWAMTREAALPIFALQRSPGFLFDLEAWLTASALGLRSRDLPVTLFLWREKTPKRVGLEAWAILRGLPGLWSRARAGYYDPAMTRPQAITADDWGLTPGVNQGILELARLGVVRRVSLMAHGAYLKEGLSNLQAVPGLSLGLHFDLTFGKSTPTQVLKRWVLSSPAARKRLADEARTLLRKQLETLRQAGIKPTHLDGHHHIHLVPGMIDALAPAIREAGIRAVRLPADPALLWHKPALWLLARQARRAFRRQGFETLPCLYPQESQLLDQGWLRAQLRLKPGAEVIVHPANRDDLVELNIPDPYTSGRLTEYRALKMLTLASGFDSPT